MGTLYVVGTPIGNLGDFSPRAVETLSKVDFIAAEDTRVTLKLLNHFGIKKEMVSYFEHNKQYRGEIITGRILAGEDCAIVTDAGMPCVSDPGELLIMQCEEKGIPTVVIPGPTAFASALAVSGLPTGRFTFEGFLSVNKKSRKEHLESLVNEERTMLFYEAPHKLPNTLKDFAEYFPERKLSIVREITKIHEEVIRTTTTKAFEQYGESGVKGEIVLVLQGKPHTENQQEYTLDEAVEMAKALVEKGKRATDASKEVASVTGFKKNEIYKNML
jgi:16S rRNA (cytidine1402-2'-O)-methyltransferase